MVGEQTGTYYAHPDVPKRIREHLPDVKLIAMFRNPVKSTYSKYYHFFNEGQELNSFDDAIKMELERIKNANENPDFVTSNPNFDSDVNFHYLRHGHYAEKLKNWFSVFPKEQILILTNDEFNADIDKTLNQVFDFLELPSYTVKNKIKHYIDNVCLMIFNKEVVVHGEPHLEVEVEMVPEEAQHHLILKKL